MKTGGTYYRAWVCDEGKVQMDTCILRTIRGRYGYLVIQNEWTWVKSGFGQRATWGWAKNVDWLWRTRFVVTDGVPEDVARSKAQAVRLAIRVRKRRHERFPETDPEFIAEHQRDMAALQRRLKHEMRKVNAAHAK